AGLLWEGLAKLCAVRRRIMPGLAYLTAGTAVCLASLSFGLLRMHAAPQDFSSGVPVVMGLVQGNILQDVKWTPEFQKASFEKYMRLSMDCVRSAVSEGLSMPAPEALAGSMGKDSGDPLRDAVISPFVPDLLLWPETAMPFYYPSGEHVDHIRNFVRHMDMPLITGIPAVRRIPGERPLLLNRACLFSAGGGESSYDKEHLVPFGEYIPPFLNWEVFRPLLQGLGGFARGEKAALFSLDLTGRGRVSLGMLICYEAIFPELAWQRVKDGAQVLLNISNDAWYDRTSAAEQHLQLAVMRAVEQGRWIARSTNTGVTAFIDPLGGVHAMAAANGGHALFTEGWLTGMVLALDGHTLYFHLHPWMPWVALTLFCLLLFSARRIPSLHARKNSIE
ncbi:MAG: apolipoprotein N-acyltransferase, partial [Mailhella sp.]|nr:apolipoprotein N-acyltransferase [Mailhella sp.]